MKLSCLTFLIWIEASIAFVNTRVKLMASSAVLLVKISQAPGKERKGPVLI